MMSHLIKIYSVCKIQLFASLVLKELNKQCFEQLRPRCIIYFSVLQIRGVFKDNSDTRISFLISKQKPTFCPLISTVSP